MWWKMYFWVMAFFTVIALFAVLNFVPLTPADVVSTLSSVLLLVGVYSYVFGKKVLDKKYWGWVFWFMIMFVVIDLLQMYVLPEGYLAQLSPLLETKFNFSRADVLLGWIINLPAVYAVYKLSGKK